MVLTALTDTLYAHVVLIFPMIIYTDSESRSLLLVKPVMDQTVHNSLGLRIKLLVLFFFPLIVIPLKSVLIYRVLNYAFLVDYVIAWGKMASCFKAHLCFSLD